MRIDDGKLRYLVQLDRQLAYRETAARQCARLLTDARAQLRRYARDARIGAELGEASLHPIVLLYSGSELVHWEAIAP